MLVDCTLSRGQMQKYRPFVDIHDVYLANQRGVVSRSKSGKPHLTETTLMTPIRFTLAL
jgi:hypothetical protein